MENEIQKFCISSKISFCHKSVSKDFLLAFVNQLADHSASFPNIFIFLAYFFPREKLQKVAKVTIEHLSTEAV